MYSNIAQYNNKVFLIISKICEINAIVILPNSSAFVDWTRKCHMPWIKTFQLSRLTNSRAKQQLELLTCM